MSMSVRDVMHRFVIAVETGASFTDVVKAMCRFHVDAVPVVDEDKCVLGVISDDDLLLKEIDTRRPGDSIFEGPSRRRRHRKAAGRTAAELMTSPAITVTEETDLRWAAGIMHKNRVKQLSVVDPETGRIVGLVRQSDLLQVFVRPGEEIRDEVAAVAGLLCRDCSVRVNNGVVSLAGIVERRSQIAPLLDEVWRVEGVVDVEAHLSFEIDDLPRAVPPLYI